MPNNVEELDQKIRSLQEDITDLDNELGTLNKLLELTQDRVSALEKLLGEE